MKSLQESIGSVRGLCQNLGPEDLEDLGLTKALHFLVENFARVKKLAWQTELDDITHQFALPTETAIYRVVQEALTNIGKHADANQVLLRVRKEERAVSFTVEDDGKGFDPETALKAKNSPGALEYGRTDQDFGGYLRGFPPGTMGNQSFFTIPFFGVMR